MKSAKYLLFVFALLAVAVFASSAIALNVQIDRVEMDGTVMKPTSANYAYNFDKDQQVEVQVEFTSLENTTVLRNVQVEARIRGYDQDDIIGDISDSFDVLPHVTYTKTLTLKLPMRLDPGQYKLRVSVSDADSPEVMQTYEVDVRGESHSIWIRDVMTNPDEEVAAGRALLTTIRLKNIGNSDENDGIKITASIPSLGLTATDYIDELDVEESVTSEELYMRIPACASPGNYQMEVVVSYKSGDKSESLTKTVKVVKGDFCETSPSPTQKPADEQPTITLTSSVMDVVAGQGGVIYPISIKNNANEARTFVISSDAGQWASLRISPSNVLIVDAGQTQTAYIYLSAKEGTPAGQNVFAINVNSGGSMIKQMTLTANIVEKQKEPVVKKTTDWSGVKKGLEITLIVIIVLVVILGIILGLRSIKNRSDKSGGKYEEEDADAQTYY